MNTQRTLGSLVSLLVAGWMAGGATACVEDGGVTTEEALELGIDLADETCEVGTDTNCPGDDSFRTCVEDEGGDRGWTICIDDSAADPCTEGGSRACTNGGSQTCIATDADTEWDACSDGSSSNTPLVLSFDSAKIQFTKQPGATFDLTGQNMSHASDWVTAATPWLALDRNGNGSIDGGKELFGSAVQLPDGQFAPNGFVALAELDDNHDGVIDAKDTGFTELLVWGDANLDRASSDGEVMSAQEAGLVSIALSYTVVPRCDARNNCERERAEFKFRSANGSVKTGTVVDVYLR